MNFRHNKLCYIDQKITKKKSQTHACILLKFISNRQFSFERIRREIDEKFCHSQIGEFQSLKKCQFEINLITSRNFLYFFSSCFLFVYKIRIKKRNKNCMLVENKFNIENLHWK